MKNRAMPWILTPGAALKARRIHGEYVRSGRKNRLPDTRISAPRLAASTRISRGSSSVSPVKGLSGPGSDALEHARLLVERDDHAADLAARAAAAEVRERSHRAAQVGDAHAR